MVQLNILSGQKAGTAWGARHFPVRIGRSAASDLQLEEPGVWEQHLELGWAPGEGFVAVSQAGALVLVDGQPVQRRVLRNGDVLALGGLRLQFWLARTRQNDLRVREALTWGAIGAISLVQVGLVYWLLQS